MAKALLALGSNAGDRAASLEDAIRRLARADLRPARISSVWETSPVGEAAGPDWFLNMVVAATTTLTAREVLEACLTIEKAMGRERTVPGGPRTIDIDLLAWEETIIHQRDLVVPHPRLHLRRFVLEPLAEVAPDWRHPENGLSPAAMLAELGEAEDDPIRRTDLRFDVAGLLRHW